MDDKTPPADREDEAEAGDDRSDDAAEGPSSDAAPALRTIPVGVTPGDGRRRLAFAARYPDSDALDALLDAFEAGNYALVREQGPLLAKRTDDAEIARAARDLVSRLAPDPLAVRMLVGAGLLLLFLIYWFYSDHH